MHHPAPPLWPMSVPNALSPAVPHFLLPATPGGTPSGPVVQRRQLRLRELKGPATLKQLVGGLPCFKPSVRVCAPLQSVHIKGVDSNPPLTLPQPLVHQRKQNWLQSFQTPSHSQVPALLSRESAGQASSEKAAAKPPIHTVLLAAAPSEREALAC